MVGFTSPVPLVTFRTISRKLSARLRTAQRLNRDRDIGVGWLLSGLLSVIVERFGGRLTPIVVVCNRSASRWSVYGLADLAPADPIMPVVRQ